MSSAFRPGIAGADIGELALAGSRSCGSRTAPSSRRAPRAPASTAPAPCTCALPSPSRQTTLRSGHATAAPVASGMPMPIDPPMFESQSCGCAARVGAKKPRPVVTASSTTIAFSGKQRAERRAERLRGDRAGGRRRRRVVDRPAPASPRAPTASASASSARDQILLGPRQHVPLRIRRRQQARLVGIGEKRDRHLRADQDDVLEPGQHLHRLIDDIRHALDRHPPAPALGARVRALRDQPRAGLGGDPAGEVEPVLRAARARSPASGIGSPERSTRAASATASGDTGAGGRRRRHRDRAGALVPRRVGRQDQGRDLARRHPRRGDRRGAVGGDRASRRARS